MAKTKPKGAVSYSNEQILKGLRIHMVDKLLSRYSFHDPMTWNGVLKRIKDDKDLARKVHTICSEHDSLWEELGLKALREADEGFNTPLFKMYAGSKKPFQTYADLELESRLVALEEELKHGKQ